MKITKRQLRRIIREAMATAGTSFSTSLEPDHMDSAEYDRGYQDGLVQYPEDPDAGPDYNAGYEDATLDRSRARLREAVSDQLPYRGGQPWQDPDVPVGTGARVYDDLDTELTDEEMDAAGYFEEESWPLRFGYTDKTGEEVEFIANNNDDADEFFAMLFKEYGRDHPYSVN